MLAQNAMLRCCYANSQKHFACTMTSVRQNTSEIPSTTQVSTKRPCFQRAFSFYSFLLNTQLSTCGREIKKGGVIFQFSFQLDTGRKKLVILGTGWSSYALVTALDKSKYDVFVVSPRNHFLFTPLLASTTVGTLEFRYSI